MAKKYNPISIMKTCKFHLRQFQQEKNIKRGIALKQPARKIYRPNKTIFWWGLLSKSVANLMNPEKTLEVQMGCDTATTSSTIIANAITSNKATSNFLNAIQTFLGKRRPLSFFFFFFWMRVFFWKRKNRDFGKHQNSQNKTKKKPPMNSHHHHGKTQIIVQAKQLSALVFFYFWWRKIDRRLEEYRKTTDWTEL